MQIGQTIRLKSGSFTIQLEYSDCFIGFDEKLNRRTFPKLLKVK